MLSVILFSIAAFTQTYIPITNNMVIQNNSNIKFAAGNYVFSDVPADGVIQIDGRQNIVLDGDSCRVDGVGKAGYMIKINNSHNVVIKNFDSVFRYKYALYITNSDHIIINGNKFCRNKVDSSGWIDVWTDYSSALGGGVMMYQCRAAHIYNNTMNMQNDGVALYHCDSIRIENNNFSWNTSYGIRMFWTDSCYIAQNNCAHVNRPLTDPSDCGALLMIVSNKNTVLNNDLSYSGDGVFLGQYQHSNVPNNNYFAYNECSYSPHNAIEATFADGNIYKHNNCNYSDYGLWLGYSFNSVVDSTEVTGNYHSGIAIDRGFNNSFSTNRIIDNPIGIELWEGSPASGYSTFHSKDYRLSQNVFGHNTEAVSSINTAHNVIRDNIFDYSQLASVYFEGTSATDSITGNLFNLPTGFHIYNNSANTKFAVGNTFLPGDTDLVSAKIYDKFDNPAKGLVSWYPPFPITSTVFQYQSPCDMAEPGSTWFAYPEVGYPAKVKIPDSVYFDYSVKKVGNASVKLVTSRGYDMALNYRPGGDSLSRWTLGDNDTLYFWVRCIKQPTYGFQYFSVRLGDDHGNYYKYTASPTLLNAANNVWKQYKMPVAGNSQFSRTTSGAMTLNQVNYVEIHADTWDYGFTLWVDGVQFYQCSPLTGIQPETTAVTPEIQIYPNPTSGQANILVSLPQPAKIKLEIFNLSGKQLATIINGALSAGEHNLTWSPPSPGIYLVKLTTPDHTNILKLLRTP